MEARVGGALSLAWKSADAVMTLRREFTEVAPHERAINPLRGAGSKVMRKTINIERKRP